MLRKTNTDLDQIEKQLTMKNARWPDMRRLSNGQRAAEIVFLRIDELLELQKLITQADTLSFKYKNY